MGKDTKENKEHKERFWIKQFLKNVVMIKYVYSQVSCKLSVEAHPKQMQSKPLQLIL